MEGTFWTDFWTVFKTSLYVYVIGGENDHGFHQTPDCIRGDTLLQSRDLGHELASLSLSVMKFASSQSQSATVYEKESLLRSTK